MLYVMVVIVGLVGVNFYHWLCDFMLLYFEKMNNLSPALDGFDVVPLHVAPVPVPELEGESVPLHGLVRLANAQAGDTPLEVCQLLEANTSKSSPKFKCPKNQIL